MIRRSTAWLLGLLMCVGLVAGCRHGNRLFEAGYRPGCSTCAKAPAKSVHPVLRPRSESVVASTPIPSAPVAVRNANGDIVLQWVERDSSAETAMEPQTLAGPSADLADTNTATPGTPETPGLEPASAQSAEQKSHSVVSSEAASTGEPPLKMIEPSVAGDATPLRGSPAASSEPTLPVASNSKISDDQPFEYLTPESAKIAQQVPALATEPVAMESAKQRQPRPGNDGQSEPVASQGLPELSPIPEPPDMPPPLPGPVDELVPELKSATITENSPAISTPAHTAQGGESNVFATVSSDRPTPPRSPYKRAAVPETSAGLERRVPAPVMPAPVMPRGEIPAPVIAPTPEAPMNRIPATDTASSTAGVAGSLPSGSATAIAYSGPLLGSQVQVLSGQTLSGQVTCWRNTYRLRYAPHHLNDMFGGSVVLQGDGLQVLQDGCQARVRGRFVIPASREEQARFQIESVEVIRP